MTGFVFQGNECSLGIKSMDTVYVYTWFNLYIYTYSLMVHGDRKFGGEVDTSNSDV